MKSPLPPGMVSTLALGSFFLIAAARPAARGS
jgi:hypothetical protein